MFIILIKKVYLIIADITYQENSMGLPAKHNI